VVKKIVELLVPNAALVALGAAFLTAFFLPLNTWGLLGTEVSALTLILSIAIWKILANLKAEQFSPRPYLWLGIATLIRLDMVLLFVAILIYVTVIDRKHRRWHLGWGLAILMAFVGVQTVFRLAYYGSLLPNTYYLNMEGTSPTTRILTGLITMWGYVDGMGWLSFLLALSLVLFR